MLKVVSKVLNKELNTTLSKDRQHVRNFIEREADLFHECKKPYEFLLIFTSKS